MKASVPKLFGNFQFDTKYLGNLNSPENFTWPSDKLRIVFNSLIAKYTTPWLKYTVHVHCIVHDIRCMLTKQIV